ncbi:MAG: hypothetical protein ACI9FU_000820 [Granulosicoccus sp.]
MILQKKNVFSPSQRKSAKQIAHLWSALFIIFFIVMSKLNLLLIAAAIVFTGCSNPTNEEPTNTASVGTEFYDPASIYTTFKLTTDLSKVSNAEKKMIPILIEAAQIMDGLFWIESYGDKAALINNLNDPRLENAVKINYGPWDRLNGDVPFVEGVGEKPLGANFYPTDMTMDEFDEFENEDKSSLYTMIRRDDKGALKTIWYHEFFKEQVNSAADLLIQAAELAEQESLKNYLTLRAEALRTDDYMASDIAWMDMKDNGLDCIIGPIENYEDKLFGYKAAHESYILIKDKEWSDRLARYTTLLPQLQETLPCDEKYKKEEPGRDSQLAAFDVVYYAGDCNAGSKTIAVNLPNDEEVQLEKGTRRSQLKNAMRAKYDKILVPISKQLIVKEQQANITFDAFFGNTMFHEVAHGLGIKKTINGKGSVREALKETFSPLEEGKADILGLYMVTQLFEMGELTEGIVMDNYVTFLAGIFRSVRFGASSAHGKANMLRFNYFKEKGAFTKTDGRYTVNFDKMVEATNSLSALILQLQGEGDRDGVIALMKEKGNIDAELQADLDALGEAGIPVDVVFEQGVEILGL